MNIPQIIEKKKAVFGAYAAMALNNVQIVLDYIKERVELNQVPVGNYDASKDKHGVEDMWEHPVMRQLKFTNTIKDLRPEKTDAVKELLLKQFPFVNVLAEKQRQYYNKINKTSRPSINEYDIYQALNMLFRVLKTYRDYTTHYKENNKLFDSGSDFLKKSEQPLASNINEVYTVALRIMKERFSLSVDDLRFIQDNRYEQYFDNGRKKSRVNTSFFLTLVDNNGDGKNLHLSGIGVAYIICQLLEKKYANVFLTKLPIYGQYSKSSKEAQLIRRSFATNGITMPKERLDSESNKLTVALDMLNELKRCPTLLFDTLEHDDQERFRSVSSDGREVLQTRSSDRFAQLVMQYIDHNMLFQDLRFQVNCGKVRHLKTASKHCIDGQDRVRVLEHRLNGFGRIQDVEQLRKRYDGGESVQPCYYKTSIPVREFEDVKRDDGDEHNYPYVVDTRTHYIINNNKINLINLHHFGDLATDGVLLCNPEDEDWNRNNTPEMSMSVLELPAMMFHMYLCGPEATERLINDTADKYLKLFEDMRDGRLTEANLGSYGIDLADMPQKVIDSVKGNTARKHFNAYVKEELTAMLANTELRLKRLIDNKKAINGRDNKMGKRSFKAIKPGNLADFLAEDIVRFQPTLLKGSKRGSDKLTGLNYRVMQATIATFNEQVDTCNLANLKAMFEKAQLINDRDHEHPFLKKVLGRNPADTVDLYEQYLKARRSYLNTLLGKIADGQAVQVPFLNSQRRKWAPRTSEYYQELGADYAEFCTIELPRQMFEKEIKQALGVPNSEDNVTHLIAQYLQTELEDDFQPFYSFKRNYRYMDMLKGRFTRIKSLETNYLTLEERKELWASHADMIKPYIDIRLDKMRNDRNNYRLTQEELVAIINKSIAASRNDYQKTEKMIRRFKVQDALLFLFAKLSLFEEGLNSRDIRDRRSKFKLKDIMPDTDKGILSEQLDVTMNLEGNYTINAHGLKIKNYGDLLALKYDKRMKTLLPLLSKFVVEKDDIEEEFDAYDDIRPRLVELIMEFERKAYERYPELDYFVDFHEHFDFKELLSELMKRGSLDNDQKEILRKIRNAFSHNSYPDPNKNVVKSNNLPEIAATLAQTFKETGQI